MPRLLLYMLRSKRYFSLFFLWISRSLLPIFFILVSPPKLLLLLLYSTFCLDQTVHSHLSAHLFGLDDDDDDIIFAIQPPDQNEFSPNYKTNNNKKKTVHMKGAWARHRRCRRHHCRHQPPHEMEWQCDIYSIVKMYNFCVYTFFNVTYLYTIFTHKSGHQNRHTYINIYTYLYIEATAMEKSVNCIENNANVVWMDGVNACLFCGRIGRCL